MPKKLPSIALTIIIAISAFLRLWRLPLTLQFLGDQGRDALIVAKMIMHGDLVFIGPVTSVGNMYLGPFYYYFMAPFLRLSFPSPLGPAYAVAICGVLAVFLTYWWGRKMFNPRVALLASGFIATSSVAVEYSRFSWNPNLAPLLGLVMFWANWKALKEPKYWLLLGLVFGLLIQLHYIALLAGAAAGISFLIQGWQVFKQDGNKTKRMATWLGFGLGAALIFAATLAPLALFDIKHGFLNTKAFQALFSKEQAFTTAQTVPTYLRVVSTIKEFHGRSMHLLFEISSFKNRAANTLLVLLTLFGLVAIARSKKEKPADAFWLLMIYLSVVILGTSLYTHTIFHHYLGFFFALTYLIYGVVLDRLLNLPWGKLLVAFFGVYYLAANIQSYPLKANGTSLASLQDTSASIYARVQDQEKYNIVLLSGSRDLDGQNYRYYLTTTNRPPVEVAQRAEVEKLFIIDEEHKVKDVTALPIYEIVVFPNHTPSEVYSIPNGPTVTVLTRK